MLKEILDYFDFFQHPSVIGPDTLRIFLTVIRFKTIGQRLITCVSRGSGCSVWWL